MIRNKDNMGAKELDILSLKLAAKPYPPLRVSILEGE